jgi:uncharacterized protein YndB with AHSA1/START domain
MSAEQKPFRVEVVVNAPREVVWHALSEPAELRRWFGWDHPGLEEEIRFIFVDHAHRAEREGEPVIQFEVEGMVPQTIELEADGPRTVVRIVCPGSMEGTGWEELYDAMEEGWRTFFYQLRHYLELYPGQDRRTLHLAGDADAVRVRDALAAVAGGGPWHTSRHQWAAPGRDGAALVGMLSRTPIGDGAPGRVTVTVTGYGLDDEAFGRLRDEWTSRWEGLAENRKITV